MEAGVKLRGVVTRFGGSVSAWGSALRWKPNGQNGSGGFVRWVNIVIFRVHLVRVPRVTLSYNGLIDDVIG